MDGHLPVVEYHIEKGANIEAKDEFSEKFFYNSSLFLEFGFNFTHFQLCKNHIISLKQNETKIACENGHIPIVDNIVLSSLNQDHPIWYNRISFYRSKQTPTGIANEMRKKEHVRKNQNIFNNLSVFLVFLFINLHE